MIFNLPYKKLRKNLVSLKKKKLERLNIANKLILIEMKTIDNFELFKSVMNFNNDDEFYFVQILVRGKDGHNEPGINGNNKNRLIKFYTVKSVEQLEKLKPEIISICETTNARAYIHPTKRSFAGVADECLHTTIETYLSNKMGLKNVYSTACGKSYISKDKKFVVDLDEEDVLKETKIVEYIEYHCEPFNVVKLQYKVPTVHGVHLITSAFNTEKFGLEFPEISVHKNNPTLLYYKPLV